MTATALNEKSESATHDTYRICRIGSLLWRFRVKVNVKELEESYKQNLVNKMCDALNKDSRVISIKRPEITNQFSPIRLFYPDKSRTFSSGILTGQDAFQVFSLSDRIFFQLQVPIKNQPSHHGFDNIPSEKYWVAWDGVTVLIMWEQAVSHIPIPGGQVITSVLSDALRAVDGELYIQTCSPPCDNVFFHSTIRVLPKAGDVEQLTLVGEADLHDFDVLAPDPNDSNEVIEELASTLCIDAETFALMKNTGRRTIDIEFSLRQELAHLLTHYYEYANFVAQSLYSRVRKFRDIKGWRREARQILATLWLSLSNLQTLEQEWRNWRFEFEDSASEEGWLPIFAGDYKNDSAAIEAIDVTHLESTVDQVAQRLDTRAVVMATTVGALAGGVAGAVVGALIGIVH